MIFIIWDDIADQGISFFIDGNSQKRADDF